VKKAHFINIIKDLLTFFLFFLLIFSILLTFFVVLLVVQRAQCIKKGKNMTKKIQLLFLLSLIRFSVCDGQSEYLLNQQIETLEDSVGFIQIKTDSVFNSRQIISLLILKNTLLDKYKVEFGYSGSELRTTSSIAKSKNAAAAVNGGFFNMDSGGSVTYFEINDTVINRTRNPELKWSISDRLINGAIVLTNDSGIIIQRADSEQFYESSKQETAVLITGPLLLLSSKVMKLPDMKFVNKRHPRTCLCQSKESTVFITVDGRRRKAEGMNLNELQQFLLSIGCINAINLDGGGSTTMWIKDKGIVNFPSDKKGERLVSNALLILNKQGE